jgi:hypothetical protein
VSAYVDQHRERFGVVPICQTLDVSASAYYQRQTGERSERVVEDERLLAVIKDTHEANYFAYGYRRMWKALLRAGEAAPRCQVQRLMACHGIQGAKRRGKPWKTTTTDPEALRSPDLVRRDFTAEHPNQVVGRGFHVFALLGGRFVLQLRDRCVQPDARRLAVGVKHAQNAGARRSTDGARAPRARRRRRARAALRPRVSTPASTTPRRLTITSCWRRSAPSAMRWTTHSPNHSSTPTKPS